MGGRNLAGSHHVAPTGLAARVSLPATRYFRFPFRVPPRVRISLRGPSRTIPGPLFSASHHRGVGGACPVVGTGLGKRWKDMNHRTTELVMEDGGDRTYFRMHMNEVTVSAMNSECRDVQRYIREQYVPGRPWPLASLLP